MTEWVIFLDDGGVMNDNRLRGMQWRLLVAEFFVPLLGGTREAWAETNRIVITRMLEPEAWSARLGSHSDYESFDRTYYFDWLSGMCEIVGVKTPDYEECIELGRRATAYVIPRVRSSFPGVVNAILTLHHQGYMLHTASGEPSSDLAGYLQGIDVLHCFGRLYGPDLINTFKTSPRYYERIFAELSINPERALVVDDSPLALEWATQAGARTVLISDMIYPDFKPTLQAESLAQLPEIIWQLD